MVRPDDCKPWLPRQVEARSDPQPWLLWGQGTLQDDPSQVLIPLYFNEEINLVKAFWGYKIKLAFSVVLALSCGQCLTTYTLTTSWSRTTWRSPMLLPGRLLTSNRLLTPPPMATCSGERLQKAQKLYFLSWWQIVRLSLRQQYVFDFSEHQLFRNNHKPTKSHFPDKHNRIGSKLGAGFLQLKVKCSTQKP